MRQKMGSMHVFIYLGGMKRILLTVFICTPLMVLHAQPKGKLFIIGGGDRPPALLKSLVQESGLKPGDYVAVLPMSSETPDTSYHYFKADLETVCSNPILNFNFTAATVNNTSKLDSLGGAKLIFITGGDQARFMGVVANSPVYDVIHKAYQNGATIAGTSAGAAVMSKEMITGNELSDTTYRATFRKAVTKNIEIKQGLGLLTNALIDQHFVVRSRYNRLISALEKYPGYTCIGIDEATAIVVSGNSVKVTGESQVLVMRNPVGLATTASGLIKWRDIQFSIFTDGDRFMLGGAK